MSVKELITQGEGAKVEFKRELSSKDKTFLKTVVAFSNGEGGTIVFGVDDITHDIIGIDNDALFSLMDIVANKISDSITPQVIPLITFETEKNKTLMIVDIQKGFYTPYYLKSEGLNQGVFIRIGATTRLAEDYTIKELTLSGMNKSYDEIVEGYEIAEERHIQELCDVISRYNGERVVTTQNLIDWKVIKKEHNKLYETVAFKLLTGNKIHFSKIQCALFKGTSKVNFIDRKEFEGPLYSQIEKAMSFLIQHINVGAKINGLVRQDVYEFPIECLREIVINAVVHRNYLSHSFIQISIYDDRIEFNNPGSLAPGLTLEKILSGCSSTRNVVLADVFGRMKLIEHWGTGIKRIIERFQEEKLAPPEIKVDEYSFTVILFSFV
ncbi:MAG: putative DNA binding domain-containing protein, partial [Sphaerochaetaceae bacterium]|nr:putative DNA binding domain-containing protein [Sphaerochaetaceae bacterium]